MLVADGVDQEGLQYPPPGVVSRRQALNAAHSMRTSLPSSTPPPAPLSQAILDTLASVRARPVTPEERQEASEPLPPPMLQNNWESASDKCFIGPSFVQSVIESTNWEYRDEGKDKSKPKLGFISTTPGSILKIKVNTTSPTGNPELPVRGVG